MTTNNPLSEHSRRRFMQTVAATGAAAGLSTVGGAQEQETVFQLDGDTPGWVGLAPEAIEGEENPTLELEVGETYVVEWENVDGLPHNFAILSGDGEQLVRSEVIEGQGETQTVEFEATEQMAEYYCEIHPDTMRGDIELDGEAEPDEEPSLEGVPVAGSFPEGETVGLQKVAEDMPALTELTYAPGVAGRNYIVTQTGQIYVHEEDPLEEPPADEDPTEEEEPMEDEEPPADEEPMEDDPTEAEPTDVATPEDMTEFLDLSDHIVDLGLEELGGYDERGLLGLAFHPEFAQNGRFYVRYSAPPREGTDEGYDHTDVLAEFTADEDGMSADPESERPILEIPQPQDNHNGGRLAFGPDGYLYTSVGDGGNVHDIGPGHVQDWYEENEGGNGQDTEYNLLGGILRIDVDVEAPEDPEAPAEPDEEPPEEEDEEPLENGEEEEFPDEEEEEEFTDEEEELDEEEPDLDPEQIPDRDAYDIPEDNPLVDFEGHLDEYYAWGFRNPWGMTIDDEGTMFVTDAGQHLIESVYIVERGGNYGWNVKEGSFCFSPETPVDPPADCPDETPPEVRGGEPLRDPIAEYAHQRATEAFIDSSVVVGGHRYEGEAIPELQGKFVFANWSSEGVVQADGELLTATDPQATEVPEDDETPAEEETYEDEEPPAEEEAGYEDEEMGSNCHCEDEHGRKKKHEKEKRADIAPEEPPAAEPPEEPPAEPPAETPPEDPSADPPAAEPPEDTPAAEPPAEEPDDPSPEQWALEELVIDQGEEGKLNRYIYGVERDADGELYVLTNTDYRPEPPTGEIFRVVPAGEGEEVPAPEDVETVPTEDQPDEQEA